MVSISICNFAVASGFANADWGLSSISKTLSVTLIVLRAEISIPCSRFIVMVDRKEDSPWIDAPVIAKR
jgi:hypothetical protein